MPRIARGVSLPGELTVTTPPVSSPIHSGSRTRGNTILSSFKDTVPDNLLVHLSPSELKRQQVIYEIYTTEKQYVNDLKLTVRVGTSSMHPSPIHSYSLPSLPDVSQSHQTTGITKKGGNSSSIW